MIRGGPNLESVEPDGDCEDDKTDFGGTRDSEPESCFGHGDIRIIVHVCISF